jgi:type II secretory pathway pseudopilin PulG
MRGFSLVELTLAIGVAAFCFIAVFGLIPVGVQTNRNSTSETQATTIIALAIADLRATQIGAQFGSPMFGFFPIPTDPTSPPQFVAPDFVPCSGNPPQTSSTSQVKYIDSVGQSSTSFNASTSRYRLIVTFVKNTTATSTTGALYVHLKVTWPAAIDPCAVTPSGSVEMFAALDRN